MSSMFTTVLNMSITASYVAIAIIIARLFLYRAPKIFSYALWTVLLFRLLCPFTFESSVSLMPVNSQPIPQNIVYVENPAIQTGIKVIDNTVNTSIKNSIPPVNQIASVNPMGEVMELGSLIWIIGILFLLTYGIITFLNLKNRLSMATLVNHTIYETDRIETPFVLGFIKPKIYIPTNLSENEFNYIIKHELTHIKRYDYIIKLIAFIALSIHWFNPIIWFSYFLMSKDMEMSCDESVMKDFNEDIRSSYSKSLLSLSAKQSGILVPLSFGESNVKSRIKNVLNYKKPTLWVIVILIIIITGIIFILGTNPMKNDNNELYEFRGITGVYEGNLYFKSETIPETIQEEIVYLDFLYTIEKNYDKKYDIIDDAHWLSIDNEKKNIDPEIYTSYVIHDISTFDKSEQDDDDIFKKYDIVDYERINVVYSQKHSAKLLSFGPQWGDGTFSRDFIVGKSSTDKNYKIYDFLMPNGVEDYIDFYGFFNNLISPKTYKFDPVNDNYKLYQLFIPYCNERGIDILFRNRIAMKNQEIFKNNEITSYNLNVNLVKEETENKTIYRLYEVSYNYIGKNGLSHSFLDYYSINIVNSKIDYIKLESQNPIYMNSSLGITIQFPGNWQDKYILIENENSITAYNKKVYEDVTNGGEGGGQLFSFERMVGELITQKDMDQEPVKTEIVLQGNGYTYIVRYPSDVQYPPVDEELSKDYISMYEQIPEVISNISLLVNKTPIAKTKDYKVVGTSFFNVEIPIDWGIKPYEAVPYWEIQSSNNQIGTIELIPFGSSDNYIIDSDDRFQVFLQSNEFNREIKLELYKQYADKKTMESIEKSFKFTNGNFNIVDLQSNAEIYLAHDGKKIFGMIDDFDIIDNRLIAVRVKVMKFKPDEFEGQNPNGFSIEDLNTIETYPIDSANIAPLAPPGNSSYSMYYMPILDVDFIKKYDYKNYFYDFIIDADGELKIVFGHYVP